MSFVRRRRHTGVTTASAGVQRSESELWSRALRGDSSAFTTATGRYRRELEVHADGLVHAETYPDQGQAITDWFDTLGAAFRDVSTGPDDTVTPTLVMAVVRGLLFDLTATGDRHRTDRALDRFAELLKK